MPTKVCLVKTMVFPVVTYGCESWTIKKAECRRIDVFELWCWRRLLRVPWTEGRSNQPILKEISPECSLEGLTLKLKLQFFTIWFEELSHLKKAWWWERLKAGGEGDGRGWDGWMVSLTRWTRLSKLQEFVMYREVWHAEVHGVTKSYTWLSNWTELTDECYHLASPSHLHKLSLNQFSTTHLSEYRQPKIIWYLKKAANIRLK